MEGGQKQLVIYGGERFESVNDIEKYVGGLDEAVRYKVQGELLEEMMRFSHGVDEAVEEMFRYVERSGEWKDEMGEEEFRTTWREADRIIVQNEERRSRKREATKAIWDVWGDSPLGQWVVQQDRSTPFLAAARKLGRKWESGVAVRINVAVVSRLLRSGKGISTKKEVMPGDLDGAAKMKDEPEQPTLDELRKTGMRLGQFGVVEAGLAEGRLQAEESDNEIADSPHLASPAEEMPEEDDEDRMSLDPASESNNEPPMESEADSADSSNSEEKCDVVNMSNDGEPAPNPKTSGTACKCSKDVALAWKETVVKKKALDPIVVLRALNRMVEFKRICYVHLKGLGGHLGLMLKRLNYEALQNRLLHIHANQLQLGSLKTAQDTYSWFRVANRPARPSDRLGPYKFAPVSNTEEFTYNQERLIDMLGGGLKEEWRLRGSVNVDLFSWWWRGPIGDIVLQEFEMYRHHLREINGKPNYGWCRNMIHSIGQQLIRQDPLYYMLYAALRPDSQWRLVTYPYYTKYAVPGDNTYFRHIDVNVPALLDDDRGACMIQGSVSMDDEDDDNATVIIPGMQYKIREWWERCVARGQSSDGFVHRITETMFTRDDAKVLGVDWETVPCQRGGVRITMPQILHGANGPTKEPRRTILPWFVGVQDDLETLEVLEAGTWSELAIAHRDMVAPRATPSGLANRYGAIPYRFPADVEIMGLGALSDALVCRRRWDSAAVLEERDLLLKGSEAEVLKHLTKWRKRAEEVTVEAWEQKKKDELSKFAEKSYIFAEQQRELGVEVEAEEDDDVVEGGSDEEGGGDQEMEFAEEGEEDD